MCSTCTVTRVKSAPDVKSTVRLRILFFSQSITPNAMNIINAGIELRK